MSRPTEIDNALKEVEREESVCGGCKLCELKRRSKDLPDRIEVPLSEGDLEINGAKNEIGEFRELH